MDYLFVASEWVVERTKPRDLVGYVNTIAAKYDVRLFPRPAATWKQSASGYYQVPWIGRMPSKAAHQRLLADIQDEIRFADWQPASEAEYLETEEIHSDYRLSRGFTEAFEKMGQYNEAILNEQPMWARCRWLIKTLTESDLATIIKLLDSWDYSFYYGQPASAFQPEKLTFYLPFLVKVFPVTSLDRFKEQLRPHFEPDLWGWLYEPREGLWLDTLEPADLASAQALTADITAKFLALTQKYGQINQS